MHKLTHSEDCFKCRDCCTFLKDGNDREAAPVFTPDEKSKIDSLMGQNDNFEFFPGKNIYKARLVDHKDPELLACVFLDQETHACKIYHDRPLDCKFWPYIIIRDKAGKVELRCFNIELCPSMKRQGKEVVERYHKYMIEKIRSGYLDVFRKNPGIILDYDDEYYSLTYHVEFLRELD